MNDILLGKSQLQSISPDVFLHAKYGNRHGMIAGATGTGKTVSLTVLAEGFSRLGVPVFLADVKGDLAGMSQPGTLSDKLKPRLAKLGITDFVPAANLFATVCAADCVWCSRWPCWPPRAPCSRPASTPRLHSTRA